MVSPNGKGRAGLVREGDSYWVDVRGQSKSASKSTFNAVFTEARKDYPFVYLRNTPTKLSKGAVPPPLTINNSDPLMRRVSVQMPTSIRAAGCMTSASVKYGDDDGGSKTKRPGYLQKGTSSPESFVHVTFIFIYEYEDEADLDLSSDTFVQATVSTSDWKQPHLIFRVHSILTQDADGCATDNSADNSHIVDTFDVLRRLASVPSLKNVTRGKAKQSNGPSHMDIAVYPKACKAHCERGDSPLTYEELGLEAPPPNVRYMTFASCAAGPIVGDGGDHST